MELLLPKAVLCFVCFKLAFEMDGFSSVCLRVEILFTFLRKFGRQSCLLHQSPLLGWVWAISHESEYKVEFRNILFVFQT